MALRPCSVEGCVGMTGAPGTAKGLCHLHYHRMRRTGEVGSPEAQRVRRIPLDAICAAPDCERSAAEGGAAKGLCQMHYKRWRKDGTTDLVRRPRDPLIDTPYKRCKLCGETKLREEFPPHARGTGGLRTCCRECYNASMRAQYAADPRMRAGVTKRNRLHRYKLTDEDYRAMLSAQEHRCPLCERELDGGKQTHVDHDHSCCSGGSTCGRCIRGVICGRCNRALGFITDSVWMARAAAYLASPPARALSLAT